MPGGRPTSDPKKKLLAVRLAERHVRLLQNRARRDDVSLSEALRRFLDEHAESPRPRARRPTAKERAEFDQVFAALGLVPKPRRTKRRR
jgi:hypothetical protein